MADWLKEIEKEDMKDRLNDLKHNVIMTNKPNKLKADKKPAPKPKTAKKPATKVDKKPAPKAKNDAKSTKRKDTKK